MNGEVMGVVERQLEQDRERAASVVEAAVRFVRRRAADEHDAALLLDALGLEGGAG